MGSMGTCNTPETSPMAQIQRLTELGANPSDYFKQAKQSGLNPMESLLKTTKMGPGMPGKGESAEEKKKKKDKKKKDKKKDKKKKDKKGKKKKEKKKRKKSSSSSSSSSGSSSS